MSEAMIHVDGWGRGDGVRKRCVVGAVMGVVVALTVGVAALGDAGPASQPDDGPAARPGVPAERLARLARGVNLPHWFAITGDQSREAVRGYITEADLRLIAGAGLTHVRLPVAPDYVWDAEAKTIRRENLDEVLRGIRLATGAGMAVIFDPHAGPDWSAPDAGSGRSAKVEEFWGALAPVLAATDPELVVLEACNEPANIKDGSLWPRALAKIVEIMRRGAPRHTIIATGDEWGGIDGLMRLTPLLDGNVVYSFHFYTPHNFTHQGATWGFEGWRHLRGLPYPGAGLSNERIENVLAAIDGAQGKSLARSYMKEEWDRAKIRAEIGRAGEWARKSGAAVYCGEFGVYRKAAPPRDRAAWLRDVTSALGELKMGWAMWDYSGGFSLTNGKPGARELDGATVEALGLKE
jgi:endoglucanase